jgi:hypothetical protein
MPPPFSQDFLTQLRAKAQLGISRRMYGAAADTDAKLHELAYQIVAVVPGAIPLFAPPKDVQTAAEKVYQSVADGGYNGDWGELKDVVRMTIVVPDKTRVTRVKDLIRARCRASEGMNIIKEKDNDGSTGLGYSDTNFVVRLSNGRPAEIQLNMPNLIYGKEHEEKFRKWFGWEAFWKIKNTYCVRGGAGHALYEIWRSNKRAGAADKAQALSKRYYDYLRGFPNFAIGKALDDELAAMQQAFPKLFMLH